ncbi:hypothetical protein [Pseudoxanthomonas wuyuanensis]
MFQHIPARIGTIAAHALRVCLLLLAGGLALEHGPRERMAPAYFGALQRQAWPGTRSAAQSLAIPRQLAGGSAGEPGIAPTEPDPAAAAMSHEARRDSPGQLMSYPLAGFPHHRHRGYSGRGPPWRT